MAEDKRDTPRPFDVATVDKLLKLMSEHDLAEIVLKEGDRHIHLRKTSAPVVAPVTYAPPQVAYAQPPVAPATSAPAPPTKNYIEIKSPMVGTFYSKPDPKKPDFVTVGAKVSHKTVVCTIEAMKLYNDVHAECSGTIAEICVQSGASVEYGTVLFRVEPT